MLFVYAGDYMESVHLGLNGLCLRWIVSMMPNRNDSRTVDDMYPFVAAYLNIAVVMNMNSLMTKSHSMNSEMIVLFYYLRRDEEEKEVLKKSDNLQTRDSKFKRSESGFIKSRCRMESYPLRFP